MPGQTPDWLHLSADERVVWERRPHPVSMGGRTVLALGIMVVGLVIAGWSVPNAGGGPLAALGVAVALAGAVLLAVQYAHWTHTRYVLTTAELYKKRGVVSRDVAQFRLDRVQNTTLEQDALGRLLGYGDLTIYTAGSGDPELTFERVPNPGEAARRLGEQLDAYAADGRAV